MKQKWEIKDINTMENAITRLTVASLLCLGFVAGVTAAGQNPESRQPTGQVIVQDTFGGQLIGYDIDQNGIEGMLSESLTLNDGNNLIATETFDQTTGKILKVVAKRNNTQDDFVTVGIVGSHIGLQELEVANGTKGVVKRIYNTVNPLTANKLNGTWTPPFTKDDIIVNVADAQGSPTTAVLYFNNAGTGSFGPFVIETNVGANTFGKPVSLASFGQTFSDISVMDYDSQTNQAVVGGTSRKCVMCPFTNQIAVVNLNKGTASKFQGLGLGFVNGIAVDSTTGIFCTTSQGDNSVEFYNIATHRGIIVPLPMTGPYSGTTVANDLVNHLFLIAHPEPFTEGEVYVYDEQGNLTETLTGFPMGPGGTYLALHPSNRTGFTMAPLDASLQSFSY